MKTSALIVAAVALSLAVAATAEYSFVSIGDWGGISLNDYHKTDELAVAKQFQATAEELGAHFVANVGDNFYYYGVWNTSDTLWDEDFENVFTEKSMQIPWYSVLGNHDYGFNPDAQLQYRSPNSDRWVMDARYYTRRVQIAPSEFITFIMLDSNPCVSAYRSSDPSGWDPCGSAYPSPADCKFHQNIVATNCTAQFDWLNKLITTIPETDWKIAVAHHVANEIDVEDLVGLLQKAKIDLYLNGHAHTLTYYQLDGSGAYVTTGAGCMVKIGGEEGDEADEVVEQQQEEATEAEEAQPAAHNHLHHVAGPELPTNTHTVNQIWNQKIAGFTTHTFNADFTTLTTNYVDYQGNKLYSFTVNKSGSGPSTGSCKTYGCDYHSGQSCQCNSYCEHYNDCCPDAKSVCGN